MNLHSLENAILNLLKNISQSDRDFYSDSINMNLIHLIQTENYKSVLFLYNSLFEPSIDKTIIYCLNNNIDCYFMYYNKKDYIQMFKATTDNHDFEFYKYTIQPIPKKFAEKVSKNMNVDLVVTPLMACDQDLKMLDYSLDFNFLRLVNINNSTKRCGYCFSIQCLRDPFIKQKTLDLDFLATEYKLHCKD